MKNFILSSFFIFSLCGFTDCSPITVTAATPAGSATPVVVDTTLCATADTHLQQLSCIPVNAPYTKRGKSFTQFCTETQNNGIYINPRCLSTITSCSQMNACNPTDAGNQ